jgi:hypothetical protein
MFIRVDMREKFKFGGDAVEVGVSLSSAAWWLTSLALAVNPGAEGGKT